MKNFDPPTFLDLDPEDCDYATSRVAILPIVYERTVSWGTGTADGPRALLEASHYIELYDEELDAEPYRQGIATLPYLHPTFESLEEALAGIETAAREQLDAGKYLVSLGGEHSVTGPLVRAVHRRYPDLGVVQFDAHADLRDRYHGTPWNHACVMRRVLELEVPILPIGIRSMTVEEATLARERKIPMILASELDGLERDRYERYLDALPENVYLTFDVDFFDPSLVPATGTPEPGGGTWYGALKLLRRLFERKNVVAIDIVELAPRAGHPASDFLVAKLLYKMLGYLDAARDRAR